MMSAQNDRSRVGSPRARRVVAGVLAVVMLSLATVPCATAGTENMSLAGKVNPVFDAMVLRPLGLATFVGGTQLFLLSVPLVLLTRPSEISRPFETLILKPFRYTWLHPIGDHAKSVD